MNTSIIPEFITALIETFTMLGIGLAVAIPLGGLLGIGIYLWKPQGLKQNPLLYWSISGIVNIVRSFPFVILLISITPLTRLLTGSSIGPVAASVPLAVAAIAYFARIMELSLNDVNLGVIEASHAMGASTSQIVRKVLLVEARSSIILGITSLSVSFLSYSAAAGIVGGGGIGDLAIRYGYYRFETNIMIITSLTLIALVQIIQFLGNFLSRKYNHA
jgi:D-methionine transport system permease protein